MTLAQIFFGGGGGHGVLIMLRDLIHDFTAVTFSAKLAFFREKRRFP